MIQNLIKNVKSRWSMKSTGKTFLDEIDWKQIHHWIDCYGDEWIAVSKLGFRIKCKINMIELSKMNPIWEIDELVNFLLDNGYDGVVNDLTPLPNIMYDISDLYDVWDNLKKHI